MRDTIVHNLQVYSQRRSVALNARMEWATLSVSNIDLGVYDARGENIAWAGAFNNVVLDTAWEAFFGSATGGPGFEEVRGIRAFRCEGFSMETWSMFTPGERITLKMWLSRPERER